MKVVTVGELQDQVSKFHIDIVILFLRGGLGSKSLIKSFILSLNTGDDNGGGDEEDQAEETDDHQSNVPVIVLHLQTVLRLLSTD